MDHSFIINKLSENKKVYSALLSEVSEEEYLYRHQKDKWCLLEIICHLYDEELYDFRTRVKSVLENPETTPPAIDPAGWVKQRNYIEQKYSEMLEKFLNERTASVEWLNSLDSPQWKNVYKHPEFGSMSAEFFLANWLAHDYLHFRQITALKYKYLESVSETNLIYAGNW